MGVWGKGWVQAGRRAALCWVGAEESWAAGLPCALCLLCKLMIRNPPPSPQRDLDAARMEVVHLTAAVKRLEGEVEVRCSLGVGEEGGRTRDACAPQQQALCMRSLAGETPTGQLIHHAPPLRARRPRRRARSACAA